MRVGIFTETYLPYVSGVTTSISVLENTLKAMGHEVFVVTVNLDDRKFVYDKKNKVIYIPGLKTGIYNLRLANIYSSKAMDIIKEWDLDVIHNQGEFGVGFFAHTVSKKLNLPMIHTYHTLYEDYVYYITRGHFDKLGRKMAIKFTKYFCEKKCDELIVPTDKIKDLFVNKYDIKKRINVIPTGIDTKKFELNDEITKQIKKIKKEYKLKDKDFIIGTVGRIAKEKSFDEIIKCMPKLISTNSNIKLMLVGDGPYINELKDLAKKLKVENNVIFTGKVVYDLMPAYYNLFNVMTSFSVTETQGLTIIEALAASKPVIAINDESFASMVTNGYNGYLFKDKKAFIRLINNIADDKDLYQKIAQNAKNSIYKYSKEVFAADVLKIYHKAIEKNSNKYY